MYVELERTCREPGRVDTVSSYTLTLLYQTLHQKPVAFGYVSRLPQRVPAKDEVAAMIAQEAKPSLVARSGDKS